MVGPLRKHSILGLGRSVFSPKPEICRWLSSTLHGVILVQECTSVAISRRNFYTISKKEGF